MGNAGSLRASLARYDRRATALLSEISARYKTDTEFLSNLITLTYDEVHAISEGATWILRAELEAGGVLSQQDVERLASRLNDVVAWQAQLHVCKSIRFLAVPKEFGPHVEDWLTTLLDAPRPFLRTWSLDAYCRLCGGNAPKTKSLLDRMEQDDSASVRARARGVRREFDAG